MEHTPDATSPERFGVMHMPEGVEPSLLRRGINRAVHLYWPPRVLHEPVLAPRPRGDDWADIATRFYEGGASLDRVGGACPAHHGLAVVDNLLSAATLSELLRWCEESTMWFTSRAGYVGAQGSHTVHALATVWVGGCTLLTAVVYVCTVCVCAAGGRLPR